MSDNFSFIKKYDANLYKSLHEAESLLKFDYRIAGDKLRADVLEKFVSNLVEQYGLIEELTSFCLENKAAPDTLHGELLFFTNVNTIEKLKKVYKGIKPLVCKIQKKPNVFINYKVSNTYIDFSGNVANRKIIPDDRYIDTFYFLRKVCNSCAHTDVGPKISPFVRNYENVLECFKIVYHIFACYFDDPAKFKFYNEKLIPLGSYEILRSIVPDDSERTGCTMEYEAKIDSTDDYPEWAIIREYKKNNVDKNFALREQQTTAFKRHNRAGEPSAKVEIITNFEDDKTPFYIIAYNFTRKPQKLENIINNIDYNERYDICLSIAEQFQKLHNSPTPIYHRMLNHNCVYLEDCSDIGSGWDVSVLKFHFSKIVSSKNIYTVLLQAKHASSITTDEAEKKYIAPEWSTYEQETDNEQETEQNKVDTFWNKVDIFSLGVLFCDILTGEIAPNMKTLQNSAKNLKANGVTNEVFNLLGSMISPMHINRPDINTVVEILEKSR